MTRATWTEIALALASLRTRLVANENRRREQIIGVELATRTVCKAIRSRSSRFDSRQFMRLARSKVLR